MTNLPVIEPPHNPMTRFIDGKDNHWTLANYQQHGGYQGLRRALTMSASEVLEQVKDSGLRGRGGAGFPTGLKWSFMPQGPQTPTPKYVIANADEMEPGAFKDRYLLEHTPHQIIEGLLIAAKAVNATLGYIFIRGDYYLAIARLNQALFECTAEGLLGANIADSDFSFELHLHTSAGRYICGEETALINALEGKRATPRSKPPFPQVSGLWGKPTIVNNVETLANLPHILLFGSQWYRGLGRHKDTGTKLFGVSGRVNNPGLWELPMGTPIREVIFDHAKGMAPGYALKGFLPGGGSTDFLLPQHLDTPMDYDEIGKIHSRMGTGTITVLDDKFCPVLLVLNLISFFAQESCGWCTPCRDGLPWAQSLLAKIERGDGKLSDIDQLIEITRFAAPGNTFCALAPGAVEPLQSALKFFLSDFERHISQQCCPYQHNNALNNTLTDVTDNVTDNAVDDAVDGAGAHE